MTVDSRKSETTVYVETQYYGRSDVDSDHTGNFHEFYLEYAEYLLAKPTSNAPIQPFISKKFVDRYYNFIDFIALLSFTDMQIKSEEHGFKKLDGLSAEINAASNMAVLKNEIKMSELTLSKDILVAVNYQVQTDNSDRTLDAYVTDYVIHEKYVCNILITNISSKDAEISALIQIPEGAIPLKSTAYLKSVTKKLKVYETSKISYIFYFPKPGKYYHTAATISSGEQVIWLPCKNAIEVNEKKVTINKESFEEVASKGSDEDIITFIATKNILKSECHFNIDKVIWKLEKKEFYERVIILLRERNYYSNNVWAYSVIHNDQLGMREFFTQNYSDKNTFGTFFKCPLFQINREECSILRHMDFFPLINHRSHGQQIMNKQFKDTYNQFIIYCSEKLDLEYFDWLEFSIYLLLQDRMHEAWSVFNKIDPNVFNADHTMKLQYDYMKAYFDFSYGYPDFKIARQIVATNIKHPLLGWRILFKDMKLKLQEFDGVQIEKDEELEGKQKKAKEFLNCALKNSQVEVKYNMIPMLSIRLYAIDIEFFFSRSPFLNENKEMLTFVEPCKVMDIKLDVNKEVSLIDIPAEYINSNIVIEIQSPTGLSYILFYAPSTMNYKINEEFGEIKMTGLNGKPLPGVYVKAIALTKANKTEFYKDGYTDINGVFDYLSLSTDQANTVSKFALLILSSTNGSIVTECKPSSDLLAVTTEERISNQQNEEKWGKGISKKMMKKAMKYKYEEEE